ncbi:MAE_28990/MAE_18760 family HEPN-like nuclease [Nocardia sp. 348MFTsu5.1]|uniref:MAE_28990/MAE_18760 family HEPN-like nuclease n=1 Tax=Nocardia sp. 348MFTsu5.1 TaxID=1172185 RepID=UPI0003704166|nr:MAE_28990/MAE_18760 family HEPN-like nuclease [Nocardia sp. 348MFTsu5.1]
MLAHSVEDLLDRIDRDLAHRKLELTALKLPLQTIPMGRVGHDSWIGRSAVALTYAHWEGFVKAASAHYIKHICGMKLPISSLKMPFQAASVVSHFKRSDGTSKVEYLAGLLTEMDTCRSGIFFVDPAKMINTESNLSSKVLEELLKSLGLEVLDVYAANKGFIDSSLVAERNKIVHGELTSFTPAECVDRIDRVIDLLNTFSNQISTAAATENYLLG